MTELKCSNVDGARRNHDNGDGARRNHDNVERKIIIIIIIITIRIMIIIVWTYMRCGTG